MPKTTFEQVGVEEKPGREPEAFSVPAQDQPVEERPDFLDQRFQSVEEQAKAYSEAEKRMAQATREAADARRATEQFAERIAELEAAQQQAQAWQQPAYSFEDDPWAGQYQRAYEEGDTRTMLAMQAQLAQAAAEQAAQRVASQRGQQPDENLVAAVVNQEMHRRFGDEWQGDLGREVAEYAQRNHWMLPPDLNPQQVIERLSEIAETIQIRQRPADNGATPVGNQAASDQAKRLAQTAQGATGPRPGHLSEADALVERWKAMPRPWGAS